MKIKPILFNTEMVRAILDGRKRVTRRVVKPQPEGKPFQMPQGICWPGYFGTMESARVFAPPYRPGDILYVRETWRVQSVHRFESDVRIEYKAGGSMTTLQFPGRKSDSHCRDKYDAFICKWAGDKWHPSIHMPKQAARLFLRVTNVRVERLQDIDDEGAKAEGANWRNGKNVGWEEKMRRSAVDRFAEIWDSTIKKANLPLYDWAANPWVWVIEFERCEKPKEV